MARHAQTKPLEYENVLAVAEKKSKLEEFLNWFKRRRHGANLEKMTIDLGKKEIIKKKHKEKKSL